jgi:large subunit ribosomal protein L25
MKTIELTGVKRPETGSTANKKVRAQGLVPAVVYGGTDPEQIALPYNDVAKALFTPDTYIVNLEVEGKKTPTLVREAQYHPVTDRILHVDFFRIPEGEAVEFDMPVQMVGIAEGVRVGGRLVPLKRYLRVFGKPADLPEFLVVDVTKLELGKTIRVGDVSLPGIKILSPDNTGIAMVDIPRALRTGEEGEEGEEGVAEEEEIVEEEA